jgi:hypothetical protein
MIEKTKSSEKPDVVLVPADRNWFAANRAQVERQVGPISLDKPSRALDILNECLEHAKK